MLFILITEFVASPLNFVPKVFHLPYPSPNPEV